MAKPTLLAVAIVPPQPTTNGYALRVRYLLEELGADWNIVLVAPTAPGGSPGAPPPGVAEHLPAPVIGPSAFLPGRFDMPPMRAAVQRALTAWRPAAALLWNGAEFLAFDGRCPPAVADRIDCLALTAWRNRHHAAGLREWASELKTAVAYARYERRVVRVLPATVVVGEDDARVLRRLSGGRAVHVIPNGVTLPGPPDPRAEAPVPTVVFTGVLDYAPNVDAACHFAGQIWPEVRTALPMARFVIAGRTPDQRVCRLAGSAGVEVRADVPDMQSVLRQAWVAVAPMRCGSGIKNKVLEAWAAAKPVVMTPMATNGLQLPPEAVQLVADTPQAIARLVVGLLRDPERRRRIGCALRHHAACEHRWVDAGGNLSTLLDRVRAGSRVSGRGIGPGALPARFSALEERKQTATSSEAVGANREVLLVVSVDTEEDNWVPTRTGITVENIHELRRLARCFDRWGVRPTYFTAYQVAVQPPAVAVLREIHDTGRAEIGAHLHPWNTPPLEEPLLPRNSMMKNLPAPLQLAKLQRLTTLLEEAFGAAPAAFRAGRFGLGTDAVSALLSCGYHVDSSVTPFVSWEATDNGPTFVGAPLGAYRIGERRDITIPEPRGPLVEIPLTCGYTRFSSTRWLTLHRVLHARPSRALHLAGLASRLGLAKLATLTPEAESVRDMLSLTRGALEGGVRHLQLFLHSPSLCPGLTPWTRTTADLERLYASIERYLDGLSAMVSVRCVTISEARIALALAEPTDASAACSPIVHG